MLCALYNRVYVGVIGIAENMSYKKGDNDVRQYILGAQKNTDEFAHLLWPRKWGFVFLLSRTAIKMIYKKTLYLAATSKFDLTFYLPSPPIIRI